MTAHPVREEPRNESVVEGATAGDWLVLNELTLDALLQVTSGAAMGISVPEFADRRTCERLADWLINHGERRPYAHEQLVDGVLDYQYYGVDRVGNPFNQVLSTRSDSPERDRYYREAVPSIRRLRKAALPGLSPIDALRLELDELWPGGAKLASFESKKMFFGIGRIMTARTSVDSELTPHIDELPASIFPLVGQFAANVYVSVPPDGGELELWRDFGRFEGQKRLPQGRPNATPDISIRPRVGELLIFNVWRLHAIRRFDEGVRASVQGFIGHVGTGGPLLLWD